MNDIIANILKQGMRGHNTHVTPRKALDGLVADHAGVVPGENIHSCWDQLYHIVFWQDLVLESAQGKDVDWSATHGKDWPQPESILDNSKWNDLVNRFLEGLDKVDKILDTIDLMTTMPSWNDAPIFKAMLVLAQHNSYHLGQIIIARKALKMWPPTKESP